MVIKVQVEKEGTKEGKQEKWRKKINEGGEEKQQGLVTEWKTTIDEQNDNKTNSKAITNNC